MLQQTQVDRVIPYYKKFLKRFPAPQALARAKLSDVLRAWQGLGYNRRALYLHHISQLIGHPMSYQLKLPGVGEYTRKAIQVFAFNKPEVLIETNIRSVFLHHFFPKKKKSMPLKVHDNDILLIIEKTLDRKNPREWYWALMDYGTHLKKTMGNQNHRSKHFVKQTRFEGSLRQERGRLLKLLLISPISQKSLRSKKSRQAIESLIKDNLVAAENKRYFLKS